MSGRRVFVTGLGFVSPHGEDPAAIFEKICLGESAIRMVRSGTPEMGADVLLASIDFEPGDRIGKADRLLMARATQMAVVATRNALEDAGLMVEPSGVIRKELDLYANIRPARTRPGVPAAVKSMDLVIARENTEGFYADRSMFQGSGEFMITEDVATAMRKITRQACQRIGETACRLAMQRRRKVTIVTKKNVLKLSDGLFHDTVRAVAESYPEVEIDDVIIDAMTALLVRTPEAFDVVVTSNMYGDILSDLANELAGGLGLGGSVNAGDEHAIAQAVHGSATSSSTSMWPKRSSSPTMRSISSPRSRLRPLGEARRSESRIIAEAECWRFESQVEPKSRVVAGERTPMAAVLPSLAAEVEYLDQRRVGQPCHAGRRPAQVGRIDFARIELANGNNDLWRQAVDFFHQLTSTGNFGQYVLGTTDRDARFLELAFCDSDSGDLELTRCALFKFTLPSGDV